MPITEAERMTRKGYIGSSDMAAILGLDKYRNAHDVFLDKTNRTFDSEPGEAAEAGTLFEPGVMDWAQKTLGPLDRNVELFMEEFHLIDHLDGRIIQTLEPVEAKTAGLFGPLSEEWGEGGTDELPDRILIQCHHHMICAVKDVCHVPAFIGGRGFLMYHVEKNQVIADTIMDKALDFWECVERDVPPENILPSIEFIKRLKRIPEKVVDLDPALVKEWKDAAAKVKWAEAVLEDAKSGMLTALGDAEAGKLILDGLPMLLTYFEQKQERVDAIRLKEELPDIAAKFVKISRFRVPRLRKIKQEN